MAGTALDWKTSKIAQNSGVLWGDVSVPGAGATPTLHSDGTPDSTAHPLAFPLGATRAGARLMVKPAYQDFNVDEFRAPIARNITGLEMMISAELVGVTDTELMELLLPGVGTRTTGSGYERVTIGAKALTYTSILLVFPLVEDSTKFGVWQLYRAGNDAGIEYTVGRTELGFTPVNFKGYEVTSRAVADTMGQFNKQVA